MYDELQLDTLGDKKTALFLIMSDTDSTFNFLISMVYTQLFNLLCDKAESKQSVVEQLHQSHEQTRKQDKTSQKEQKMEL